MSECEQLVIVWRWLHDEKRWLPIGQPMSREAATDECCHWDTGLMAITPIDPPATLTNEN